MPTNNGSVTFKYGTGAAFFDSNFEKDNNTIYFLTDSNRIFIGENEYSRPILTGTTIPGMASGTAEAPLGSLYVKTYNGDSTLYIKTDTTLDGAWTELDVLPNTLGLTTTVGTNSTTTPAVGGSITIPQISFNGKGAAFSASDQTITLPTQDLSGYAPLASPALTGTPTAPTAAEGTNTTQIATTAFVKTAVDSATAGLAGAMHYIGVTTTTITDGSTTSTISINSENITAATGDVVIYGSKEFVFNGTSWAELGDPSNYILKVTGETGEVPKFDANGNLESTGFTLGTSVPANAVFTDTTYTIGQSINGTTGKVDVTLTPSAGSAQTITIPEMTGATTAADGATGTVPKPSAGDESKFLAGDGTWKTETDQRARWGSF